MLFESINKNTHKCCLIAEVAQAHDGSLGTAHAYIDAIADAGADAVKFQTHIAEAESTPEEPWRVKFSKQDKTRYDYWKRMEFTKVQWKGLKEHAEEKGLLFLSSPFSFEAVDLLEDIGIKVWKIASGEVNNTPLLDKIAQTKKPVIISSGMSAIKELDQAVNLFKKKGIQYAVMQCTAAYPCPPEKIGLNLIHDFRRRYKCPAGLSDHSGTIFPGLAGAASGMDLLEIHVTFSRQMFGPDVAASVTLEELKTLVEGIRYIELVNANPVKKDEIYSEMRSVRKLFTKSIITKNKLKKGTILKNEDLTFKKPGNGIPPGEINNIIGKKLIRDVPEDHFLSMDDLG
ncbi:MAG: N-acetylneuraminate synthase [Cytophagales bacterium]|nr:N-acetylneuraminate synthase [Cytophagales bacterium]